MGQLHSNLRQRCQRPVPGVLHSTRSNTYRESGSPRSILDLWLRSRHPERSASNHHPQRLGHWDQPARARIFHVDLAFSPKRMSARPPLGLCTCRDPISQTIRVAEPREGRSQVQRCLRLPTGPPQFSSRWLWLEKLLSGWSSVQKT